MCRRPLFSFAGFSLARVFIESAMYRAAASRFRALKHTYLVRHFRVRFFCYRNLFPFVPAYLRCGLKPSSSNGILACDEGAYVSVSNVGERSITARFASTSVAKSSSSAGFFSWLTGERTSSLPPLDFPLPDVTLPPSLPDYVEPGKMKITTLANGVKIASETSANPAASIGLYVDCGSVYETPISIGATHLLERMAFKSTRNRSHLRIVREVEAVGGNVTASASREQMGYSYDALKTYVPEMVEVLIDSVRNPVFLDWEVTEQLQKVKAEIAEISNNPQGLLLEAIHCAGYSGALGHPLLAPESAINRLNSTILEEFVVENYTAPRLVLAASGVEHEELLSYAEPLLSDLPKVSPPEAPKSVYVGGDYRCQADSPFSSICEQSTHVALAFEVPGGWLKEKEAMTLTVLQMLMGGGGSFSAGGPGKGMYSRLCELYLGPEFVSSAVDLAARELLAVATPGQGLVSSSHVQLDRAKEATKSAVLMNLESRMVAAEDIGRQILTYGERKPIEHFLKAVDEVKLNDITCIAQKMISSPLTMAAYGDVTKVPTYDSVAKKFQAKKWLLASYHRKARHQSGFLHAVRKILLRYTSFVL
ncbi:hypothetical protein ACLOJK_040087 [Asimina triloba]